MKNYTFVCTIVISTAVAGLAQSGNWTDETVRAAWRVFSVETGATNHIGNAAELAQFAWFVSNGVGFTNTVIMVTNSLYLSEHFWMPAGNDGNHFDGTLAASEGVIVDGMTIKNADDDFAYAGLFGCVGKKGRVEHIVLTNISINVKTSRHKKITAGGIAGVSSGVIANCAIYGAINAAGNATAGGIVGDMSGAIANCMNRSEVSVIGDADSFGPHVGGIAGNSGGDARHDMILNCENYGVVRGETAGVSTINIGGIAGENSIKIVNCANYGTISGKGGGEVCVGGIAGWSNGVTANCINFGALSGLGTRSAFDICAGGIVGYGEGEVSFCYWNAAATAPALGVVGYEGFLCYVTNSVSFNAETGVLASPVDGPGVKKTDILLDALNAWIANPVAAWFGGFYAVGTHKESTYATWTLTDSSDGYLRMAQTNQREKSFSNQGGTDQGQDRSVIDQGPIRVKPENSK